MIVSEHATMVTSRNEWDSCTACTDFWCTWSNVSTSNACRGVTSRSFMKSSPDVSGDKVASIWANSWLSTDGILSGKNTCGASRGSSAVLLRTGNVLSSWEATWQADA